VLQEPGVQVPHPRFRDRSFVLDPLCEIAPGMVDPVTGLTVAALRAALG
jgi:2-amino-4-hydroxy-6-hydroxymethyldihydropteridine diphosphokinase